MKCQLAVNTPSLRGANFWNRDLLKSAKTNPISLGVTEMATNKINRANSRTDLVISAALTTVPELSVRLLAGLHINNLDPLKVP